MSYANTYSARLDWDEMKKGHDVMIFADYLESLGKDHRVMIIHDNDPDGHCAFHVLKYYFSTTKVEQFFHKAVGHGKSFQNFNVEELPDKLDLLIIVDHMVNEELVQKFQPYCETLAVIDHHIGTVTNIQTGHVIWNTSFSSSALADMVVMAALEDSYPGDTAMQIVVEHIDHYDMWRFGHDEKYDNQVKSLVAKIFIDQPRVTPWESLMKDTWHAQRLSKYIQQGEIIREVQSKTIENIIEKKTHFKTLHFKGRDYRVAMVFHSDLMDEIASRLIVQYSNDINLVIVVSLTDKDKPFKLSLRSSQDHANVQVIAESLGGSGHRSASGAELSSRAFAELITGKSIDLIDNC